MIDWSNATYRSIPQLIDWEKDEETAMTIAKTCLKLGPPFFKYDKLAKVWRFASVQEGTSENCLKLGK